MAVGLIRRGDIFLTHFGPARAGEPDFKRPAVVITNNVANAKADALTVVPLTSNLNTVYDFQLLLPTERTGLNLDSKAQTELITCIAVSRIGKRLGQVPEELMTELDGKIRLHLAL
ncbi:type II toxin-antitoxin system PemK/MazF family toxin [Deinococcus fonticola]|uniref:type II toxin-antitoxin system PemK/MazF family toxin n=1 Tax=Deinococcus fonticola TaxID=2528713 RepID=UPI001075814B|nr:type II toxin-antitoxin system PemK/MazF family toxin [Deinococcus fonticola]